MGNKWEKLWFAERTIVKPGTKTFYLHNYDEWIKTIYCLGVKELKVTTGIERFQPTTMLNGSK